MLTSWRRQKEGFVRTRKESNRGRALTHSRRQRDELVKTRNETNGQGALTSWRRQRDSSEHVKKAAELEALTSWRRQGVLVRIWKEPDRTNLKGTHFLETAEGETFEHGK